MAGTVVLDDQLRQLSSFYGIEPAALAALLRTTERDSRDASARQSKATVSSLVALQQRLDTMFTTHAGVERWLHGSSGYFGGDAPFDSLSRGQIDRVNAALDAIEAGIFV